MLAEKKIIVTEFLTVIQALDYSTDYHAIIQTALIFDLAFHFDIVPFDITRRKDTRT